MQMPNSRAMPTIPLDADPDDVAHWEKLQALYHAAAGVPAAERQQLLEAAGASASLVRRVLNLLASDGSLREPPQEDLRAGEMGGRIGPYELLRHLGSGGLGSVYLCERLVGGAVQQCALKLLVTSSGDPSFRARFEREQQILAKLSHPHITRLLDAGLSETNQPYLVMDFVDGVNLTHFADQQRLSIAQRVQLLLDTCDAVAYAHRNLIVHLDLKPSNILVTADGQVKLLDFGQSRLVESEGAVTTTMMATPAYASPEQLCSIGPMTTACDVYALGAILYELLSGQRAFPASSMAMAISRAVHEQEPQPIAYAATEAAAEARGLSLRRLRQTLAGDLSKIVAKCMRSRPQDRYTSVEALASDLRSSIENRPVSARRQTIFYVLKKFSRRNRALLAAAAAVLLLLATAGTYAYTRQQRALVAGRRAEQMQTFLSEMLKLANQSHMGRPAATVPELLRLGDEVLPQIIKDPADQRAAELSLGESMYDSRDFAHAYAVLEHAASNAHQAGDTGVEAEAEAFAGMAAASLGRLTDSQQHTAYALTLVHGSGVGPAARVWVEASYATVRLTQAFDRSSNMAVFEAAAEESRSPEVPERERLWVLEHLAQIESTTGRLEQAGSLAHQAEDILKREPYALCDRAGMLEVQANLLAYKGRDVESIPLYRESIADSSQCAGADNDVTLRTQNYLARSLIVSGQREQGIELLNSILPTWRASPAANPAISIPLTYLARAYLETGQPLKAEAAAREGLAVQVGKVNPLSTRVALCRLYLAEALYAEHRTREALGEAEATDQTYAQITTMSSIERSFAVQAHALLVTLQKTAGADR